MCDSRRRYRAIRDAVLQLYPMTLTATRRMSRMMMERTVGDLCKLGTYALDTRYTLATQHALQPVLRRPARRC